MGPPETRVLTFQFGDAGLLVGGDTGPLAIVDLCSLTQLHADQVRSRVDELLRRLRPRRLPLSAIASWTMRAGRLDIQGG